MGCCQSTDRHDDSPPSQPIANDGTSTAPVLGRSTSEIPASRSSHSPRHTASSPRSRGRSGQPDQNDNALTEHFNKPLVPHVWDGKHKYTRHLPGPNARRKTWTRRSLEHEREVFFETQTTGAPEVWGSLRLATEMLRQGDISTAQTVVDAAELTVPYGDPAYGVFDSQGQFYQMPEWAVADPTHIIEMDEDDESREEKSEKESEESESRREMKGKGVMRAAETFDVKARLSDRGGPQADILVNMGYDENVRVLTRRVKEEAGLSTEHTVRIAYLGRILKENTPLKEQGYKDGHMVNALVSSRA